MIRICILHADSVLGGKKSRKMSHKEPKTWRKAEQIKYSQVRFGYEIFFWPSCNFIHPGTGTTTASGSGSVWRPMRIQDTDPHDNQCFYVQNFYKKLNLPVPGTWDSTVYVVVQFKCGKQLLIYLSSEIKLTCLVWPSCWQQQRTAVGQQLTSPHHHSCGATYQGLSHGQHSPTWHHELQKWDLKPIWTYAISTIAGLF